MSHKPISTETLGITLPTVRSILNNFDLSLRHIVTPVPTQRFETLAIDLFGTLPESKDGKRWILIIEDCTTKWVELFALPNATAKECVITLIEEILLWHSSPSYQ
ncbi:integrase_H2C2 domain-containing protein [Trichonephila clavipes]|nr:integrase_H2C2 domain-containing protein [Trichonephila clavipes]